MVVGELGTAIQNRLPIIVIIFNNGLLQIVSAQQTTPYGTVLNNPDFVVLAHAFGANGAVVDGTTDVDAVLRQAFENQDAPFVIDLRCDPRIMAPLSKWEKSFACLTVQPQRAPAHSNWWGKACASSFRNR